MKKLFVLRLTIILLLFSFITAKPTVWYVHPDSTLNSIQIALYSCSTNDTVLVGPGTYVENINWPYFTQGINLISELGADMTIIDGDSAGSVIKIGSEIDSTTTIKGFTIQNGRSMYGGGIACYGLFCSPSITGNIIIMNTADSLDGGGIYCYTGSSPTIDSCTISNNNGDGIYCISGYPGHQRPIIHYNNITDNTRYGVYNKVYSMIFIDARYNWWGDSSGPGGSGPGTGDEVNYFVFYNPWLTEPVSGIEEDIYNEVFFISQCYPNPFMDRTQIEYNLPRISNVNIAVYNVLGARVITLLKERQNAGIHTITWDSRDERGNKLPSGFYFLRLEAGDYEATQKMLLLR